MTPDQDVTVKGLPVRSLQNFIERELTAGQRDAAFCNLPPAYAARLKEQILPTEKVPVAMLNRLTEEAARARGESLEDFGRRAGCAAATDAIHGVYRFFALALTPAALLTKGGQLWTSVYSRGQLVVQDQTSTSARLVLQDFKSEPAGCARITGWIEKMAELTGVTVLQLVHDQCSARGAKGCAWELRWK